MAKESIIQRVKECYLCRIEAENVGYYGELTDKGLHQHHIMFGTANRQIADKWGVWCWLCPDHHEHGPAAVHRCRESDLLLKKTAQKEFEKLYSHEKWMQLFGENYLSNYLSSQENVKKSQEMGIWFID